MNVVIHPRAPIWPENTLRFHLAFERPMDPESALRFVDLFRSGGEPVHGAFVDLPNGLWTPDQKVLTVLFHPGRVKSRLSANRQLGRALREGESYAIRVSARMRDAYGNCLGKDVSFEFTAGPAVVTAFQKVHFSYPLGKNAREAALRIASDRPIDWLSAQSELCVSDSDRRRVPVFFDADAEGLLLRPTRSWPQGTISLEASEKLEDSCGNRQTEPFEMIRSEGRDAEYLKLPHDLSH